jgi:hypothetical protein
MLHDLSSQLRILNAQVHNALSKEADAVKDVKFLPTPLDDELDDVPAVPDEARAEMESAAARLFANN